MIGGQSAEEVEPFAGCARADRRRMQVQPTQRGENLFVEFLLRFGEATIDLFVDSRLGAGGDARLDLVGDVRLLLGACFNAIERAMSLSKGIRS